MCRVEGCWHGWDLSVAAMVVGIFGSEVWCVQTHIVMVLRSTHVLSKNMFLAVRSHIDPGSSLRRFSFRSGYVLALLCPCLVVVVDLVVLRFCDSCPPSLQAIFGVERVDMGGGVLLCASPFAC